MQILEAFGILVLFVGLLVLMVCDVNALCAQVADEVGAGRTAQDSSLGAEATTWVTAGADNHYGDAA